MPNCVLLLPNILISPSTWTSHLSLLRTVWVVLIVLLVLQAPRFPFCQLIAQEALVFFLPFSSSPSERNSPLLSSHEDLKPKLAWATSTSRETRSSSNSQPSFPYISHHSPGVLGVGHGLGSGVSSPLCEGKQEGGKRLLTTWEEARGELQQLLVSAYQTSLLGRRSLSLGKWVTEGEGTWQEDRYGGAPLSQLLLEASLHTWTSQNSLLEVPFL